LNPVEFLQNVVEPNFWQMRNEKADYRLAFNAVAATDALAAHVHRWTVENRPELSAATDDLAFRREMAEQNGDFALLRDIAVANKHCHITRGDVSKRSFTDANEYSIRGLDWEIGGIDWRDLGAISDGKIEHVVVIDDRTGYPRIVEGVARHAIDALRKEMARVGLFSPAPPAT
jgi:hypothetical protein